MNPSHHLTLFYLLVACDCASWVVKRICELDQLGWIDVRQVEKGPESFHRRLMSLRLVLLHPPSSRSFGVGNTINVLGE